MHFIGIDPSTSSTGYAVVDENRKLIDCGRIEGLADDPKSFAFLYKELTELMEKFPPTAITCETQFIGPNRETSIKLIRPTGVVLTAAGAWDVPFDFIAPSSWRHMYQGTGKWSKRDTYDFTMKKYSELTEWFASYALLKNGKISTVRMYNNCNDMTDAIGLANACAHIYQFKAKAGEQDAILS